MKLKKLTIKAYEKEARSGTPIGAFEAMFNPESFSQKYEIRYSSKQGINSTDRRADYANSNPRELNLKLVLDGTNADEMDSAVLSSRKSVSDRVKQFLDLTWRMNGKIHQPNFLVVEWGGKEDGGLIFSCRLASVNVSYTSFDRDGSPLRAELDINLISDEEVKKRTAKDGKTSPDLTHSRIVKSGDTLPLLTKEVYGTSAYYLRVAQVNRLNDFRNLTPGQELLFPPLESQSSGNR
jgi:nucleoid-associated protein YgaU